MMPARSQFGTGFKRLAALGHVRQDIAHDAHDSAARQPHFNQHPHLRQRRDLLISIPGVGETTASRLLGEMPDFQQFSSAKAVAAYAGLSRRQRQSGSSIRGKTRLAKTAIRTCASGIMPASGLRALCFPGTRAFHVFVPMRRMTIRSAPRPKSHPTRPSVTGPPARGNPPGCFALVCSHPT